jgi:hypothetical protein
VTCGGDGSWRTTKLTEALLTAKLGLDHTDFWSESAVRHFTLHYSTWATVGADIEAIWIGDDHLMLIITGSRSHRRWVSSSLHLNTSLQVIAVARKAPERARPARQGISCASRFLHHQQQNAISWPSGIQQGDLAQLFDHHLTGAIPTLGAILPVNSRCTETHIVTQ